MFKALTPPMSKGKIIPICLLFFSSPCSTENKFILEWAALNLTLALFVFPGQVGTHMLPTEENKLQCIFSIR